MEAHVVRDGAIRPDVVPLDDLRATVSDFAVEDVRHRNQRPKVALYSVMSSVCSGPCPGAPRGSPDPTCSSSCRLDPWSPSGPPRAFDLTRVTSRWPIVCTLAPGTGAALYAVADEIVDDYLGVVEEREDRADDLEELVFRSEPVQASERSCSSRSSVCAGRRCGSGRVRCRCASPWTASQTTPTWSRRRPFRTSAISRTISSGRSSRPMACAR